MEDFGSIVTACAVFGSLLAALILVNNARKAVNEMKKPYDDMSAMVASHEAKLEAGTTRMDKQDRAIDLLLRSNKLMMQHMAYGNHSEQLKDMCDRFDQFLIEERQ